MVYVLPLTRLQEELRRLALLESTIGLLGWDEQVNLPPDSAEFRGRQMAALADLTHRERTSPAFASLLTAAETLREQRDEDGAPVLDEAGLAILREARKAYDNATRIPPELVQRRTQAQSRGFHTWLKAREASDFSLFQDALQEQLDLCLEVAAHAAPGRDPYDYWIDQFDPGMDAATITGLFTELKAGLQPIVRAILESPVKPSPGLLRGFPEAGQETFLREILTRVGFDFSRGRLDRAVHPFCSGNAFDTRLTTRYREDLPLSSLFGSLHEAGHGMYEQGLPLDHFGNALGEAVGMAVHESQSRIWENQVGRSPAFWQFAEPRYREIFAAQLAGVSSAQLFLAINGVGLHPIRVESDEVTYNLHIMLRFDLERRLFSGQLKVADLPAAWVEASRDFLDYTPKNDREGVLQDVHWSGGAFGYFPSYSLGNLLAAQLWYRLRADLPDLDQQISRGEFAPFLAWLRTHVHAHGRRWYTQDFARRITGEPLNPAHLLRYLRERYLPLYA